ncbi:MAG: [FeFe] hydrogenase H-cluster radical SAM maturase HydE [Endomicrobiia bacterium]
MKKKYILQLFNMENELLIKNAFEITSKYFNKKIFVRGLIEFSNYCVRNCFYCGLRRDNKNLQRYRMDIEEIFQTAKQIIDLGIKTVVLQSGDDFYYTEDMICRIIEKIKKYSKDVAITLSIGERKNESYKKFYDAGADRFLLKHETSNEELYNKIHPGMNFKRRKEILFLLKEIGFQVGAGNIVGLPEQNLEDIIDDIIFMKELDVDMAGIGPFIPQKDTPFKDFPKGDFNLVLKTLAITRIVLKTPNLPATTATVSLFDDEMKKVEILKKCFLSGANVVMVSFTPENYKKNYKIYDQRKSLNLKIIKQAAENLGLELSFERGDSLKKCILQHQKV